MHQKLETKKESKQTEAYVTLTEPAANKIKELMKQEEGEVKGLRFSLSPGGCSGFQYGLDFDTEGPKDSDNVSESFGVKVFVEKAFKQFVFGTVVDYVEGLHDAGFKIENPNSKSSCGCGHSDSF